MLTRLLSRRVPDWIPTELELRQWAHSEWIEYQAWLFRHDFLTLHDWQNLRAQALAWGRSAPLISVITPVYNTEPAQLRECARSVLTQAYPRWEWRLVDDASTRADTQAALRELATQDPRIHLARLDCNQGICGATNHALRAAQGDFVAFLDHDDRLSPAALFWVADCVRQRPSVDVLYSDRDMLSPHGHRFMHLFKPGWSPETLLSGNYLFHLAVYRRALIHALGGLRADYEGSQDFDLILRAADQTLNVAHIARVLYHWRQHEGSIALAENSKTYTFSAGLRALHDTAQRRGLRAEVSENPQLWRGNYRLHLAPPAAPPALVRVDANRPYAAQLHDWHHNVRPEATDFVLIMAEGIEYTAAAIAELLGWMQIHAVGMVTGKLVDSAGTLLHAGLVLRPSGIPLALYQGHAETTPGYLGVTAMARNVAVPHPYCCAVRRELWQALGGLDATYSGPHALLDLALRAAEHGWRVVYQPFACCRVPGHLPALLPAHWPPEDARQFATRWASRLAIGDPYYNPWLTLELADMGLDLSLR